MWFSQALNKTCWCKLQLAMRRATKNFPQVLPEAPEFAVTLARWVKQDRALEDLMRVQVHCCIDKQIKHPGCQGAGSTGTYLEVAGGGGMESITEFADMLVATGSFGCQRVVLKCWQFKT